MKILTIIPAHNEPPRVAKVVAGTLVYLPTLVVDDGSNDGTNRVAEESGALVIRQVPNQGKGAALRTGFRYALDNDYDAVIMLDGDGQHDPAEIPKFLRTYQEEQADLIIGMRDFSQIPLIRKLANTIGGWSFSWAIGVPIADNQSGYRLLSKRMMEAVLLSQESGFEFEVEMITSCVVNGYRLSWVPIRTIYGEERSHISPLKHAIHFYRIVWQSRQKVKDAPVKKGL